MAKKKVRGEKREPLSLPFQRPYLVATLAKAVPTEFDLTPDADEMAAIRSFLGNRGPWKDAFQGHTLSP